MKKHLYKLAELIFAVILGIFLFPFGFIFNIFLITTKKLRFFKFFYELFRESGKVIFELFRKIALIIDLLGNVILGPALKFFFVKSKYQYQSFYGIAGITISTATGHDFKYAFLTDKGIKFKNLINKLFEFDVKYHCENAYKFYIHKLTFRTYDTQ